MSYKRDIYPYTYVRCICEIMTKDAKYNAVCHWIVNCYLSTKEGLKVFYVNISHHVPHVCWHLTGPSIMASSAFILTHLPQQTACHDGLTVHTAMTILYVSQSCQPSEEDNSISFCSLPRTDTECLSCSSSRRQTAWETGASEWGCPGLAYQWPQWQMCCLIPELAAALAGVNMNWLTLSRSENPPPM